MVYIPSQEVATELIMSQLTSVKPFTTNFLKIVFKIFLSATYLSSKLLIPLIKKTNIFK
jgi:hypothetical protein